MTPDQIGGIVRALLTTIGGLLIAKGLGDQAMWEAIAGGGATIVVAVWSWHTNKPANLAPK